MPFRDQGREAHARGLSLYRDIKLPRGACPALPSMTAEQLKRLGGLSIDLSIQNLCLKQTRPIIWEVFGARITFLSL